LYHRDRTHLSLDKDAPEPRPVARPDQGGIVEMPMVGGLHHRYTRLAAYDRAGLLSVSATLKSVSDRLAVLGLPPSLAWNPHGTGRSTPGVLRSRAPVRLTNDPSRSPEHLDGLSGRDTQMGRDPCGGGTVLDEDS
jgi:hypothetical protein